MKNFLYYLGLAALGIILIMVTIITILLFAPNDIVTYDNSAALPVLTKTVKRGEDLQYVSKYCINSTGVAFGYRTLIDQAGRTFPSPVVAGFIIPGCFKKTVYYPIGKDVPPGVYKVNILAEFHVNYIRVIYKTITTQNFTVL